MKFSLRQLVIHLASNELYYISSMGNRLLIIRRVSDNHGEFVDRTAIVPYEGENKEKKAVLINFKD